MMFMTFSKYNCCNTHDLTNIYAFDETNSSNSNDVLQTLIY